MGIDIYMSPNTIDDDGVGTDETNIRYFDTTNGDAGYLREAYHGGPYVTEVLVPEAFEWTRWLGDCPNDATDDWPADLEYWLRRGAPIHASVMRGRLVEALEAFERRIANVYPDTDEKLKAEQWQAFVDFVELAERIEAATGEAVQVYASY